MAKKKKKKWYRKIGRVVGKIAPIALPLAGTALGGPFGALAGGALGAGLGQIGARGSQRAQRAMTAGAIGVGGAAVSAALGGAAGDWQQPLYQSVPKLLGGIGGGSIFGRDPVRGYGVVDQGPTGDTGGLYAPPPPQPSLGYGQAPPAPMQAPAPAGDPGSAWRTMAPWFGGAAAGMDQGTPVGGEAAPGGTKSLLIPAALIGGALLLMNAKSAS
ncbi:MAG: hypothetical protein AAB368_14270 [bacterium]